MSNMIKGQKFYRMPAIVRVTMLGGSVYDFTYPQRVGGLQSYTAFVRAAESSNKYISSIELFFNGQRQQKASRAMGVMSDAQEQFADLKYQGQRFFIPDDGKNVLEVMELKFNIVDIKLDTSGQFGPRYQLLINMEDAIPISKQGEIVDGKLVKGLMPEMTYSITVNGQREKMYESVAHELLIKDFTIEHDSPDAMYGPCVVISEGKRREIVEYKDKAKVKKLRPGNDEGFLYGEVETRHDNGMQESETADPFLPEYVEEAQA